MAETLTIRTASSTEVVKIAVPGPQGATGAGVPTGGSTGQVLRKASGSDYDTEWAAAGAGSGSVTSVALASTDLTISGSPITDSGTITANIAANAVTLEKLQTISSEHLLGRHGSGNGGVQQIGLGTGLAMSGSNVGVTFGSSAGTACEGNDARLSDARTPSSTLAHAASHASAGSDPLFDQDLNTTDNVAFEGLRVVSAASQTVAKQVLVADDEGTIVGITGNEADARASLGLGDSSTADIGTAAGEVAAGDHTHGNLTNDGKIGSTAGLPVVTTTAGAVTTLALGTANQVLRVNSGATGVEFADPAASGVTGAAASASDVLGVSGANITGVDANADRIVYWNNTSNKLAYGTPADAGAAASSHTHAASDIASGTIDTARLASGTANSGTFLRGDQTWAAVSGVTIGSVDNAVLRADTGNSTSQSSDINIEDATTSTENNVTISNQHSGQTNSSLVLSPKGTGAFILGPKPSATLTGGNSRGTNSVDLQISRTSAGQVASGTNAVVLGGRANTASADRSVAGGDFSTASGSAAVAIGSSVTASGNFSCAFGASNTSSGARSSSFGQEALADRFAFFSHSAGLFAAVGDAQRIRAVLRCKTTTNAAVEMALNGTTTYLTIPSGKVIFCNIKVVGVKSDGSVVATYERQYAAKNVAGTSSEVYAAVTIGTDNAASTSLEVATVDAGDYIRIRPTGIASETWRWVASVDAVEVAYGT